MSFNECSLRGEGGKRSSNEEERQQGEVTGRAAVVLAEGFPPHMIQEKTWNTLLLTILLLLPPIPPRPRRGRGDLK